MTCDHFTTWAIFRRWPDPDAVPLPAFSAWFWANTAALPFGVDRRYYKNPLLGIDVMLGRLRSKMGGAGWAEFFGEFTTGSPGDNFRRLYAFLRTIDGFGRLIPFTMSERFWNLGFPIEPERLDVFDPGSRPFRNGLVRVLGRDDLDTPRGEAFDRRLLPAAETELEALYEDCRRRWPDARHSLYHFETCLCTYKGWWRGRRYTGCYNDMYRADLDRRKRTLSEEDADMFERIRAESLPEWARCELTPGDPGYSLAKRTWFLETGEAVTMRHVYPDMDDSFLRRSK